MIEDNMMEIEAITGNEENVIIIEEYYVIDKNIDEASVIEWKFDRRYPMVKIESDGLIHSE